MISKILGDMMGENYTIALIVNSEKTANEISESLEGTNVNIEPIFDVISAKKALNEKKYDLIVAFENTPLENRNTTFSGTQNLYTKGNYTFGHLAAPQVLFNHKKQSDLNKNTTYIAVSPYINPSVIEANANLRSNLPDSTMVVDNNILDRTEMIHISEKIMEYLTKNKA